MKRKNILKIGLVTIIAFAISGIGLSPNAYYCVRIPEYWAIFFGPVEVPGFIIIEEILIDNGLSENHIKKLYGSDATATALYDNITNWLDPAESHLDTLLLCLCGHGTTSYFEGHNNDNVYYTDLNNSLNELESGGIAIIIDCCESGQAISKLKKDGRVITTSVNSGGSGSGMFTNYIAMGLDVFGDYCVGAPGYPPGNTDGVTSLKEAYCYLKHDFYDYQLTPMFQSFYPVENNEDQLHIIFHDWENGRVDQLPEYNFDAEAKHDKVTNTTSEIVMVAQLFRPSFNRITKTRVHMRKQAMVTEPLWASIREQKINGEPGDLVCDDAEAFVTPSELDTYYKYITFDFPIDVVVDPNENYFIVLEIKEVDSEGYYIDYMEQNHYAGGCKWLYDNENWLEMSEEDVYFVTYGYTEGQNIKPYVPKRPSGDPTIQEEGTFCYWVKTDDVNGNDVKYFIDWGDTTFTGWSGPFESGSYIPFEHTWESENVEVGEKYFIRVKAMDHGVSPPYVTEFSDPLIVLCTS